MNQEVLIEKYLQNRLSSEEKLIFEELLNKDAEFKDEVAFHVNLKRVVQKEDEDHFKSLISDLEKKKNKPQKKHLNLVFLAAASLVLLLGLTYFFNLYHKPSSGELFAFYFQPYENVIYPIERGSDQKGENILAFYKYEEGDYEAANQLFSQLYDSTKESFYLFYQANALLKLERAKEAVPLLLEHLKTKDALTEKTKWYLALAYLKVQDDQNAKKILKEVIDDRKFKTKDAKKLLKKID